MSRCVPRFPPNRGFAERTASLKARQQKKINSSVQPAVFEASLIASDFQISIVDFVPKVALVCHVSLKKLEDPRG